MTDRKETVADVLKAMRDETDCNAYFHPDLMSRLRGYADRIEDALASNETQSAIRSGNVAKLREALEKALIFVQAATFDVISNGVIYEQAKVIADVQAALAAPPRNCDVGTAKEQDARFARFCNARKHCLGCPVKETWPPRPKSCGVLWGQLPYAAEGGKA